MILQAEFLQAVNYCFLSFEKEDENKETKPTKNNKKQQNKQKIRRKS